MKLITIIMVGMLLVNFNLPWIFGICGVNSFVIFIIIETIKDCEIGFLIGWCWGREHNNFNKNKKFKRKL
jgi:hypothetical protein